MVPAWKSALKETRLYEALLWARARRAQARRWKQERRMRRFYSRFVTAGALCFDVGANVGSRAGVLLALRARVVAVEPQVECVRILRERYGHEKNFTVLETALGESIGVAEMKVSKSSELSSLSLEWISAVKESGRFADCTWDETRAVPVTTLDALIGDFGTPSFVKIDVEGFEYPVLKGLSRPVGMLSFEFSSDYVEPVRNCIEHLGRVGSIQLNYSLGESMVFALRDWVGPDEMERELRRIQAEGAWGDVYARFQTCGNGNET